ncbi:MAG: cohesin domain-containing protein, partial [Candidatus Azambacteria bacterium]|nr:cohesin domain-containing protein [Candidatus Azambacteria bacterium]
MFKLSGKNLKIKNGGKKKFVFKLFFLPCLILFGIFASQNAQAATSYFSPSSGNFTVGNIFTVNVLVNTEGVAINNAEATINFPSSLLEIVSISKSGSIFSLWVEEPTFSNSAGTLSFNGGLPTPGFNGAAGKVLGAVFRVKKEGSASLVFSSAAVRANDGYGTNVFKSGAQAIFNLISEGKPLPPT